MGAMARIGAWARGGRKPAATRVAFHSPAELERWMTDWIASKLALDPGQIARDTPFIEAGLDSLAAVEFSGKLEEITGREVAPSAAWEYPTIAELADHIFTAQAEDTVRDMDL